jgi:hypothetical protein
VKPAVISRGGGRGPAFVSRPDLQLRPQLCTLRCVGLGPPCTAEAKDQSGVMRGHGNDVFFLRVPAGTDHSCVRHRRRSRTAPRCADMRLPCVGPRACARTSQVHASRATLTDAAGMVTVRLPSAPCMAWDALATALGRACAMRCVSSAGQPLLLRAYAAVASSGWMHALIAAWFPSILYRAGLTPGPPPPRFAVVVRPAQP